MSSAGFENQVQVHRLSSIKKHTWWKWQLNLKEFIIYFTSKIVPTHTMGALQKMLATIVNGEKDAFLIFPVVHFFLAGLRSGFGVRWGRRILWQLVLWQEDFGKELCAGWRILLFRIFCWYSCLCFEWYLFSLRSPPVTSSRVEFRVFAH